MPSTKRSPISYAPNFGGGIFRSKSAIDSDLALLDPDGSADRAEVVEADGRPDPIPDAPIDLPELPSGQLLDRSPRATKRNTASKRASSLASVADSKQARTAASAIPMAPDTIETIRRIVKEPGREVTYVRLSPEEKAQMSEVVYAFKRRGQKLTETEISRLAVNYVLADYHQHGEESLLARLVAGLRA